MQEQEIYKLLEDAAPPSGLPPGFSDGVMVALEARTQAQARARHRRRMVWAVVSSTVGLLGLAGCAALFPAVWFYVKMAVLPIALVAFVQYLDVRLVQAPMLKKQMDG